MSFKLLPNPNQRRVKPRTHPWVGASLGAALPQGSPPGKSSTGGERPSLRKSSGADRGGIGFSRSCWLCQARAGSRRVQFLNIHHCLNSVTLSAASGASAGPASPGSDGPIKHPEIPGDWGAPGPPFPTGTARGGIRGQ